MEHKTFEELRRLLKAAETKVVLGGKYTHYKQLNKFYTVTGLGILEASDEVAVSYTSEDNQDIEFVRSLSIWLETVEWNGQTVPRFLLID